MTRLFEVLTGIGAGVVAGFALAAALKRSEPYLESKPFTILGGHGYSVDNSRKSQAWADVTSDGPRWK